MNPSKENMISHDKTIPFGGENPLKYGVSRDQVTGEVISAPPPKNQAQGSKAVPTVPSPTANGSPELDLPQEDGLIWIKSTTADLKGKRVGEYEITGIIGEGGMGYVLKGIQPQIRKRVAIKVLKPALTVNEQSTNRFLAEAQAVNAIGHPNIIDTFSFGRFKEGLHYFVMEYLEGETLLEYMERVKSVPYRAAQEILEDIFDALKAAHNKGIVHRDLKPDNIFLLQRKGRFFPKILDFGLAKISEEGIATAHTKSGVPVGTPLYMSPEQCMGENVDERSDIYAMGIILYKMFTGVVPFQDGSFLSIITAHLVQPPHPPSKLAKIPQALEAIILKALEKERTQRFQSIEELEALLLPLLEELAQEESSHAQPIQGAVLPTTTSLNIKKMATRSTLQLEPVSADTGKPFKVAFFALLALVLLSLAGGGGYLLFRSSTQEPLQAPLIQFSVAGPGGVLQFIPPQEPPTRTVPKEVHKKETVFVNLLIEPRGAKPHITLNGTLLKKPFFEIAKSKTERLTIVVTARGYHPTTRSVLPAFNQNITISLKPLAHKRTSTREPKVDLPDVL